MGLSYTGIWCQSLISALLKTIRDTRVAASHVLPVGVSGSGIRAGYGFGGLRLRVWIVGDSDSLVRGFNNAGCLLDVQVLVVHFSGQS